MNKLLMGLLLLSLGVAGGLALFASGAPDGLEHSMERVGSQEGRAVVSAPMPDYEAPWFSSSLLRKSVGGLSGTLIVFGLVLAVGACLRRSGGKD